MSQKRKNIRLKKYDYSQPGCYFITICTQHHLCLFGSIKNNEITLNDAGEMINKWWEELTKKYQHIQLHHSLIMPNHFHGIIQIINPRVAIPPNITDNDPVVGADLPQMIQWFKTMTTNEYMRNVKQNGWVRFAGKLWQRNYYEHIIRNEKSYNDISEYIMNNPVNWEKDQYYHPQ